MRKTCFVTIIMMLFVFQTIIIDAAENSGNAVPKQAEKLLKKAEQALKEKQFDKALESLNKAMEAAPEYAGCHFSMAHLLLAQQKYDEAAPYLENAIRLDPENAEIKIYAAKNFVNIGRNAYNQKDLQKANGYFEKMLAVPGIDQLEPALYKEVMFQVGADYSRMNNPQKANDFFLKVLAIPNIDTTDKHLAIQTSYQLGFNFYNMQKPKESNQYFEKVISFPEVQTEFAQLYISTYYLIGLNAAMSEEFEKSDEFFSKFLELGATSSAHAQLIPLANMFMGTNRMSLLTREADKIKKDQDKDKKKRIADLALANPEIEAFLLKAIELQNNLEPAVMNLGNYYYYCNNLDKAIEKYEKLIAQFPNSMDINTYKNFLADIKKERETPKTDAKTGKKK